MIKSEPHKKLVVIMPAYNAAATLEKTVRDIPQGIVDEIILVDDNSSDATVTIAHNLGITVFRHKKNRGYGANQKKCYLEALKSHADIIVMLHPDYQYDSTRIYDLIRPIKSGREDITFGSRIRTRKEALAGGMPHIKYILNRIFCIIENITLGTNYSEFFSGFRAYSKNVIVSLPIEHFSDDFVFDQQLMISAIAAGFRVGETPIPVRYFSEASSIGFVKGCKFLLETLLTLIQYKLFESKLFKSKIFL